MADAPWTNTGRNEPVGFPNTAYYLPIIYGISGMKVEKLGDMEAGAEEMPSAPAAAGERAPPPALPGPALDAGMATFFAEEIIEAIRYLDNPNFYAGEEATDRQHLARRRR